MGLSSEIKSAEHSSLALRDLVYVIRTRSTDEYDLGYSHAVSRTVAAYVNGIRVQAILGVVPTKGAIRLISKRLRWH